MFTTNKGKIKKKINWRTGTTPFLGAGITYHGWLAPGNIDESKLHRFTWTLSGVIMDGDGGFPQRKWLCLVVFGCYLCLKRKEKACTISLFRDKFISLLTSAVQWSHCLFKGIVKRSQKKKITRVNTTIKKIFLFICKYTAQLQFYTFLVLHIISINNNVLHMFLNVHKDTILGSFGLL